MDGGDFAQWCRLGLPVRRPASWLWLGPMGTVGAAIPFGIEAMGGVGVHVTHLADLRPALQRAANAGTVACVNVALRGLASPLTQANIARHRKGR